MTTDKDTIYKILVKICSLSDRFITMTLGKDVGNILGIKNSKKRNIDITYLIIRSEINVIEKFSTQVLNEPFHGRYNIKNR